mgnify:CR=1 FL=1
MTNDPADCVGNELQRTGRIGAIYRCCECGRIASEPYSTCMAPATPYQKHVARVFGSRPPTFCVGWMTRPENFARGLP